MHKLEKGPGMEVSCTKEEALEMYKKMQAVRQLEITADKLYKEKQIRGFIHLYAGQVRHYFNFPILNIFKRI